MIAKDFRAAQTCLEADIKAFIRGESSSLKTCFQTSIIQKVIAKDHQKKILRFSANLTYYIGKNPKQNSNG